MKRKRTIAVVAASVVGAIAAVVAWGLGSEASAPPPPEPPSGRAILDVINSGKAKLLTTEVTQFRMWYNCAYRSVPVPVRHYAMPDGGEVSVHGAPDTSALGPRDPACDGVEPTAQQSAAEVARSRAEYARLNPNAPPIKD